MNLPRRAVALLAASSLSLTLATPAEAAGPKVGVYYCYDIYSNIRILPGNHYKINSAQGNKGDYVWKAATKKIVFKTGDYRGFYGKLTHGGVDIDIYDRSGYLWSCGR